MDIMEISPAGKVAKDLKSVQKTEWPKKAPKEKKPGSLALQSLIIIIMLSICIS